MLGTRYGSVGPDFSDPRDPIFSEFRDTMIVLSDSEDPIWKPRDTNGVPKAPLKKPVHTYTSWRSNN